MWRVFYWSCAVKNKGVHTSQYQFLEDFMKKYLMMAAVLVGQLFASSDVSALESGFSNLAIDAPKPLKVRFINATDLSDSSPIHEQMKVFVGATTAEKWAGAVTTMQAQINANTMRRLLVYRGDELVCSYRTGRMPLGMQPYFCDSETDSSEEHNALRGPLEIDDLTKERLDIIKDLYISLGSSLAMPSKLVGVVRESNPAMPVTLVDNGLHAATIMFSGPIPVDSVVVQNAVALQLIMPAFKVSRDSNITEEGYPSFIISQLPQGTDVNISGLMDTYVVDLPYDVGLAGITPTLITVLRTNDGCIAERLTGIKQRVDQYKTKL